MGEVFFLISNVLPCFFQALTPEEGISNYDVKNKRPFCNAFTGKINKFPTSNYDASQAPKSTIFQLAQGFFFLKSISNKHFLYCKDLFL